MFFEYYYAFLLFLPILFCEYKCKKKSNKILIFTHTKYLIKTTKTKLDNILELIFLSLLIIAIANPFSYKKIGQTHKNSKNIIFVLDNSPSMYWKMGKDKKIDIAKRLIKQFIVKRKYDNIGLVVFAGKIYYLSPLTINHNYLLKTLDFIKENFLEGGTSLYDAIIYASKIFKNSKNKDNILVVLTDGADTQSEYEFNQLLNEIKYINAKIYSIGIGNSIDEDVLIQIGNYKKALDLVYSFREINNKNSYNAKVKTYYKKVYYFKKVLLVSLVLLITMIIREYYASRK